MKNLFTKRRNLFISQCLKYARYVFNDHFVLFLLMFFVFLAMQYSQFLQDFPTNHFPVQLVLVFISLFLLPFGGIATYVETPDKHFLLVKESELHSWIKRSTLKSYFLWVSLQTVLLSLLYPVFAKLGISIFGFICYLVLLAILKYSYFQFQAKKLLNQKSLKWEQVIQTESRRKQSILRFFSLFTTVKGISNSVKRRKYLDFILNFLQKTSRKTWTNLFLRSFLRNGEFFGLVIRLLLLSIFFIIVVRNSLLAILLAVLLNYLLIFQLMALYQAYDYQYLTILFPLKKELKQKGVQEVIQAIAGSVLLIQSIFTVFFLREKIYILLLIGMTLCFIFLYTPYKLKRQVDE
ncbi:ABC transporter, permease protein EscB [Streptococcus sp. DD10]|uniref:ABC transporter permease n=1 Tax=Streptococcus sp. DD10 TaxID=1777878 RepID=UPI00079B35B8|nr:ABC transporter permease [Streptococcus sp. DD10]KXT73560.1 ABC transporter, permease protein EscB [Streptococcus sp. DD10]